MVHIFYQNKAFTLHIPKIVIHKVLNNLEALKVLGDLNKKVKTIEKILMGHQGRLVSNFFIFQHEKNKIRK